jgi:hypothetical protein
MLRKIPAAIESRVFSMEERTRKLHKELGEAEDRCSGLEDECRGLRSLAATYRANWIHKSRELEALERFGPDDMPCISQPGWFSSSPDRSDQ